MLDSAKRSCVLVGRLFRFPISLDSWIGYDRSLVDIFGQIAFGVFNELIPFGLRVGLDRDLHFIWAHSK